MKKTLCIAFFTAGLATLPAENHDKPFPERWVRVSSNLRDHGEVERVCRIVATASEHGLNGMTLSAGLDQLDLKPREFFERLNEVRGFCAKHKVDIIPSFFSAGYGGAVLSHDKNLAAGLPVRDAVFITSGGKAKFRPDPAVKIANGSFEVHDEKGQVEGFNLSEKQGVVALDTEESKDGKASLRFETQGQSRRSWAQISQAVTVQPYRCYRIRCWVKSKGTGKSDPFGSGNFLIDVLGGEEKRPLQYENPRFTGEEGWQQVAVGFNSGSYSQVEIAPKARGSAGGKLWLDGLEVKEVGLVNVLRRPGTPLVVHSAATDAVYEEGRDYAAVADPQLNFRYDHDGPDIDLLPGTRIPDGARLKVSYYHGTTINNDQTPVCMSEPKVYEIWADQARRVHAALAPEKYLLNMDEVRAGGTCDACRKRSITMGQMAADCVTRQFEMLRKQNPNAQVYVWSDMFDPNHNANPDRQYYYLTAGNYAGSWDQIPKDLGIVCWFYQRRVESLKHFSDLGFRTIGGAYYDADDLENPKGWLEALHNTPGAVGILYTTWLDKYDLLAPFGDLVSK